MKDIEYYLAFSHFLGIGPNRFDLLIKEFGTAEGAYRAPQSKLAQLLGGEAAAKFEQFKKDFDPAEKIAEFKKKEITVVTREDRLFPPQFKNLPDVPICIYVKGNIEDYDFEERADSKRFFAIVGTRRPTAYGQQITYRFAKELAAYGFIIVSGLALGVDALSHKAALDAGETTIAILGCGVDIVYPPTNRGLYESIIETGGLILSEFPPGQTVRPGLFVARNRLISGLSCGVLVIEGTRESGALITARYAALQGRDVFAPPVPLTSVMSEAPNILLKEGAKLVTSAADILEEYSVTYNSAPKPQPLPDLSDAEQKVYDLLTKEPYRVDDIAAATRKEVGSTLQTLSIMEIKGLVEKNPEGRFQIK